MSLHRCYSGKTDSIIAKAGSLDHVQPVIITILYLFIYQRITFGAKWSGAPAFARYVLARQYQV